MQPNQTPDQQPQDTTAQPQPAPEVNAPVVSQPVQPSVSSPANPEAPTGLPVVDPMLASTSTPESDQVNQPVAPSSPDQTSTISYDTPVAPASTPEAATASVEQARPTDTAPVVGAAPSPESGNSQTVSEPIGSVATEPEKPAVDPKRKMIMIAGAAVAVVLLVVIVLMILM